MPREIIDTQSSRPRYVRRVALTIALTIVVAAAVVLGLWAAFGHFTHAAVPGK